MTPSDTCPQGGDGVRGLEVGGGLAGAPQGEARPDVDSGYRQLSSHGAETQVPGAECWDE